MIQSIPVPDSSYSTQRLNVANTIYNLQLSFNSRDLSWYLDIFDIQNTPILQGKKIQFGSAVTGRYLLTGFDIGNLYVAKTQDRNEPLGRDNFGENKLYEFWFITKDTEQEIFNE